MVTPMTDPLDAPSPIDLRSMEDARRWAESAMAKRPWRTEFFDKIAQEIPPRDVNVLELGSGPGFLAERLLQNSTIIEYVALDSSTAMHILARTRLGAAAARVRFVEMDFRLEGWTQGLPLFDAVVTIQTVHELRHKRHAPTLYAAVRNVLRPNGIFLICDHFVGEGGMSNGELFMRPEEHVSALKAGGFASVVLMQLRGLILFKATVDCTP
jgi:SAM-dependent methyltransferase